MPYRKPFPLTVVFAASFLFGSLSGSSAICQAAIQAGAKKPAAANQADSRAVGLPVRRVSLYKNGIGFFEHIGSVTGNEKVTIDFTTAQLNDVLQTLTAIDLNGGHIAGAGYNSTMPFDQQLKALPLALGEDPTAADFYQAIRGARIEVHSGTAVFAGRLLNLEVRSGAPVKGDGSDATPANAIEKRYLTVISDSGAVRSIELTSGTEVRLLDTEIHQDVARYLELLASSHNQGLRHLTLAANGTGTRELHVSYISEVPIWKCTYRILFTDKPAAAAPADASGQTATLQGWAVVDNTVGADWDNVELSLIAGAPQSFIQPISQPYYSRRPEIPLPEEAQLTPQTHESGDSESDGKSLNGSAAGALGGAMGTGNEGGIGSGSGQGFGPGAGGGTGGGIYLRQSMVPMDTAEIKTVEDSAAASTNPNTKTSAFDDYFEYKLADPITIRKNESALVPILQTKVDAERVTLWSPSEPQPLRALWVTNTSDLTIDRGSFSILEDGRFAGEGLLDVIHPNERRLLSYAADQAVRVTTENGNNTRRLQEIAVSKGILTARTVEVAEADYAVHNAAAEARKVIVEHPRRQGWELDSDLKPTETTPDAYRFEVSAAPGDTVRLHVGERHTLAERYDLARLPEAQFIMLMQGAGDSSHIRGQLAPIFDAKRKLADLDAQIHAKQVDIDEIGNDQKRLRDNLAALKGSPEERDLVRRYTGELNQQEDRLADLRKSQAELRQQRAAAAEDLDSKIQALQLEEKVG